MTDDMTADRQDDKAAGKRSRAARRGAPGAGARAGKAATPAGRPPVHAFRDDALGAHDAVALAALVRDGEVGAGELARAAVERIRLVDPELHAVAVPAYDTYRTDGAATGPLAGVPTLLKDNTDYGGLPTGHGSAAFTPQAAPRHAPFTRQFLSTGMTFLGKTRLPEFGFNASTEYEDDEPVRNPWHPSYSPGGSSGGSAALVASGAVPIAHANDGGGSIRIPAACCGLVGLKPTRGRVVANETGRRLPIDMVGDGVLSRSVRDTAAFLAAAERHWRNPRMPPLGLVEGPGTRRLRIGLVAESPTGVPTDAATRAAVAAVATALAGQGHTVETYALPLDGRFEQDFIAYWGLLAFLAGAGGRLVYDRHFDARRMDGLSKGLRSTYVRRMHTTPAFLRRLRRAADQAYDAALTRYDVLLSPVLAHTTPRLGHLSPNVPYEELLNRLRAYVAFTPINNINGSPAISLPAPAMEPAPADGMPVGVMLSAAHGDERTLLELAFALEADLPWRRIQDA
ncbi:amidase [Streptomyces sp. CMB-StM0423]|uniref:amidase n=1 Tax=Streptomyces sp. CMB-StM0423 TaxID=2059884 RepID=UPI000C70EB3E|nr:amidase [Streptomyces sp. CMB-StM0423]AUH43833.1 amidase [Streptomyces sp. CMB-StM0423]